MPSQYDDFFNWLGELESGDFNNPGSKTPEQQYEARNKGGYVGKYQMGEGMLADLGYYTFKGDPTRDKVNDWKGDWTGKRGLNSLEDFRKNGEAQEYIVREEMRELWRRIERQGLDEYVGTIKDGVRITESGLLAAAHNLGVGRDLGPEKSREGLVAYLRYGINDRDGNENPITRYLHLLADFQTPFDLNPFASHYERELAAYAATGKEPTLGTSIADLFHDRERPQRYIWHTMGDEKVRPEHSALGGEKFDWDAPPSEGNPGDAPGCRCWAESVLEQDYPLHSKSKSALHTCEAIGCAVTEAENYRNLKKALSISRPFKALNPSKTPKPFKSSKPQRRPVFWMNYTRQAKQDFLALDKKRIAVESSKRG